MRKMFLATALLLLHALVAFAQITGASLTGRVLDDHREALVGVVVSLVHVPTAIRRNSVTDAKGYFTFPEVKAGEGYFLSAAYLGFRTFKKPDLHLFLGETISETIILEPESRMLNEVVVRHNRNLDKKGAGTNFIKSKIERLPALSNGLQDITRLSPFASGNSFAGTNYRYNNLTIDGAVNNDAFGFVEQSVGAGGSQASGTPGSLARTQPISLDAIQELQVAISPFDVTMGNFTGGSINAVTRSGTNDTHGAVYSFLKNQNTTGGSADAARSRIEHFSDYLSGASLGGALVRNKVFYFTNLEYNHRTEPAPFAAGSEQSAFRLDDIQRLADTIQKKYGYDAGSYDARSLKVQNFKFFARIDWHISERDQVSIRHNMVDASAENLSRAANIFNFGSQGFTHFSQTNSTVFEWKRRISERFFHKIILSHAFIDEHRASFGQEFPHVEINYGTAGTIFLGQYREATIFRTRQRTFEFTDNLQYFAGNHRFTLGTHNEYYGIRYHFVTPWTGRWAYSSLDNFFADKPGRIRRTFNLSDNGYAHNYETPSAQYGVVLGAAYLQDEMSLFDGRFTVAAGMRVDASIFPVKPVAHADVLNTPAFSGFDQQLGNKWAVSPRVSFNYKLEPKGNLILRGGSGVFVGRMPFAWLTYAFLYDGNHFGNVDYRPGGAAVPLQSSVSDLVALQGGFQREINLLDPRLRLPQVWRNNLALDKRWGSGWAASIEGVFTKTMQDTKFETKNLNAASTPLGDTDDRARFSGEKINPGFTSVFVVTNTQQGYRYNLSAGLQKTSKHWDASLHYTFGESRDLANGVRVSPQANWEWNQTIDPNNPRLSYSNFDTRHRILGTLSWMHHITQKLPFSISLVYVANSGVPFSYVYNGDVNRDGSPTNDLIFVPATIDQSGLTDLKNTDGQVVLSAAEQWQNLQQYIENDAYLRSRKGGYVARNGARSPWNQQLDLRFLQQIEFKNGQRLQCTLDLINVSNLISKSWGRQYFVSNTTNAGYPLLTFLKMENDRPRYRFDNPVKTPWQFDPTNSRMQGQLGLKLIF